MAEKMKQNDKNGKKKLSAAEIICLVCAVVLMIVPFVPFVFEMDVVTKYTAETTETKTYICAYLFLYNTWLGDVKMILSYLPVVLGIIVIATTLSKKNLIRIIMMVMDVAVAGFWICAANRIVAKIFEGDLYEPGPGYYMLLVAAIVVLIATLNIITKEKNAVDK